MDIICLIKTFSGHEFATASLESIYDFCKKIVYVHSSTSWSGKKGNNVSSLIEQWKKSHDKHNKIINLYGDWKDQDSQYDYGFQYIKKNLKCDFIMLVDTDEVWTNEDLERCKKILLTNKIHNSFTCNMHTYIKSIFYRVKISEPCKPTIFIRNTVNKMLGVRGNGIQQKFYMNDVYMHHFCYVRESDNLIKEKFITSEIGDKNSSHNWNEWKKNIWDKITFSNLNNVKNVHPTIGAEHCWSSLIKINKKDLPITVQNNKILKLWNENTGDRI